MKKTGLLVVLALVVNTFFAQDDKLDFKGVELGVPYPAVDARFKKYFAYEDLIIGVKFDGKKFYLQTFHTDKLTLEKIKIYDDFPKDFQMERFLEINKKVYLFYYLWDKVNTTEQLFYREINPETCSFVSKGELLLAVKGKVTGHPKFKISSSFDGSKILVRYRKNPKHKDDDLNKGGF